MELKEQILNEISNIEKELKIIHLLNTKNQNKELDDIEIRGASLSLGSLYNGIERVLSDLLKSQGISLTNNSSWHTMILNESLKREVISKATFNELKGFLAFRHFVRHAYSFEIDSDTITNIISKAPDIIKQFINEILVCLN
ncbi:MAG: hypothetical protein PQJ46_08455 [Spirochaetales bacterium]|nr:hypothetical protein [Spirochaetales bacterium]